MSLRSVALDPLHLVGSYDKLKLSVTAFADILCPSRNLLGLGPDEFLDALTSASIWVARGSSCRIEICLTVDGDELLGHQRNAVMESLGNYIRDAPFWSQLSLTASLRVPYVGVLEMIEQGIVLNVDHQMHSSGLERNSGSNLDHLTSFRPPEGILCTEFSRLSINLAFQTAQPLKATKRAKYNVGTIETRPSSGQEHIPKLGTDDTFLPQFEKVVGTLRRTLPSIISSSFESGIAKHLSFVDLDGGFKDAVTEDNMSDDEDLLFPQSERTNISTTQCSSLPHPAYTRSTGSVKRGFAEADISATALNVPNVCLLAETALRLIISGYSKGQKNMRGVSIQHPWPNTALCEISPLLWCPKFKVSMNQNAQFLPTISQAICSSWLRNAQSPSLQQKLSRLANSSLSIYIDEHDNRLDARGTSNRLTAVIQSRLWAMMQRKLYDSSAARRLRQSADKDGQDELDDAEFDDLLCSEKDPMHSRSFVHHEDGYLDYVEHEEDNVRSDFHDLLAEFEDDEGEGEEIDLLADHEQMEGQAIERETDIMLLKEESGNYEDDEYYIIGGQADWNKRCNRLRPDSARGDMLLSGGSQDSRYFDWDSSLTNHDIYGAMVASSSSVVGEMAVDEEISSLEQCSQNKVIEDDMWSDEDENMLL